MALIEVVIANPPISVKDAPALGLDQVTDPTVVHSITLPIPGVLTSATDPPVTKVWSDEVALVAGAKTLDLQALVNDNLPNVDLSGLKIQVLQISCPETNTGPITIVPGAANDYDLGGSSMSMEIDPGDVMILLRNDTAPDVSGANSELDFSGTGTETFEILIAAG